MKTFSSLITLAALSVLLIYSGCGSKNSETLEQKNFKLFSNPYNSTAKTWKVDVNNSQYGVSNNGVDNTQDWTNFTINFSGSADSTVYHYTCSTNRPALSVWPSKGKWSFDSVNPTNTIDRDPLTDNLQVGYVLGANGTTLQLKFTYNGTGYSRVENVQGTWIFNLIPQ